MPQQKRSLGRTRCGAPIGPAVRREGLPGRHVLARRMDAQRRPLRQHRAPSRRRPHEGKVAARVGARVVSRRRPRRRRRDPDAPQGRRRRRGGPGGAARRRPALGGAHRRRHAARRPVEGARTPGPRPHVRHARGGQADALAAARPHRARGRRPHGAVARGDARDGRRVARGPPSGTASAEASC